MNKQPDFYDIYDYYYPAWWTPTWVKIALIIGSILLIGLVVFFITTRKKRQLLPWEWAEEQLNKLSAEGCKNKTDFKKFYFSLTAILKHYFHLRYFWQTEDKTDEELILLLHEQNFDHQQLEHLKKIFTGAIWIKFANEEALKSQALEDKIKALELIEKTKPSDYKKKA
jgi:hypothetical protein